jgi:hypothetical protein
MQQQQRQQPTTKRPTSKVFDFSLPTFPSSLKGVAVVEHIHEPPLGKCKYPFRPFHTRKMGSCHSELHTVHAGQL